MRCLLTVALEQAVLSTESNVQGYDDSKTRRIGIESQCRKAGTVSQTLLPPKGISLRPEV